VPIRLYLPAGYTGPQSAPAGGAPPAEAGQLVVRWSGAEGAVEARWPATPAYRIAEAGTGDPISVTNDQRGTAAAIGDALVPGAKGAPADTSS
jgi:hypothetical protein